MQALSALLEPQGKMLQVTSVIPETNDATPETMSSGGSDNLETQGKADKPTEHSADLSPAALQQVVLQSGVIKAVLQAVRHAGNRSSTGNNQSLTMPCHCLCAHADSQGLMYSAIFSRNCCATLCILMLYGS